MISLRRTGTLLAKTAQSWMDHNAPRIGAALAFYTLLAFPPLVVLSVTVASLIFSGTRIEAELIQQVRDLAGTQAADLTRQIVEHPASQPSSPLAAVLGMITLLIGASGIFAELRAALNTMWAIPEEPGYGIIQFLKSRLFSMGMVFAGGFLLMASLIISTILAAIGKYVGGFLPVPVPLLEVLNFIISFAGSASMFALILRYIPDRRLPWHIVSSGALVTAFLFSVGKSLIGIYLGRAAIGSPYGAGGSVVIVMAWVYYSAQIFLFGAEFTQAIAPPLPPRGIRSLERN